MPFSPQFLINGLIAGAIYALVASGFSLIYNTAKFVHFAHGATIALSAYFLYTLFSLLGIPFSLSILFTLLFSVIIGLLMNILYKQFRKRKAPSTILLIASIALLFFLEALLLLIFGANVKTIPFLDIRQGIEFQNMVITPLQIFIIISSLILFLLLLIFMKNTKIGKAMRAVADNKEAAEILGISSERIYLWTFMISSFLAGVASILIGLEQNLTQIMGTSLIIKGFTASIIGGIGSVPGAVLGSFLLGIAENLGIAFLPSGYKDAIAFLLLFLFLLIKPEGILGKK